jgi:hypothetical protein
VLKPKPSTLQVPTSLFGADGMAGFRRIERQAARLTAALAESPSEAWSSLLSAVETRELASPIPEILRGPPASACFMLNLVSEFVTYVRVPKLVAHDDDGNDATRRLGSSRRCPGVDSGSSGTCAIGRTSRDGFSPS